MILYADRKQVPDPERISPELLRWCLRKAELANGRYQRLDRYYRGEHDIFRQGQGKDGTAVAVNYARYVVEIGLGYYLGKPVKYDPNSRSWHSGKEVPQLSPILSCYDRQHISRIDQQLGRLMGVMGDCLELCYASTEADPRPRSSVIDPRNGILVCDTTVEHRKLFALVWEKREDLSGERYYDVTIYTDRSIRSLRAADLETAPFLTAEEAQPHYFGGVPVIAYENNWTRQGDFEPILSLIDAYNELMSSRLTDKKKFVDALLVFYGMTLAPGEEDRLMKERFIDGAPLDARAEYIQKTFDEAGVQVLADALVREMHKMTLTVDMSDQQFAGNISGQALKLKLLTMDQMVQGKMAQMERGFKERMTLYNRWLTVKGEMMPLEVEEVDVVFTLNLPINEQERVELVTKLQGIVDDQTLLSQLWFIKDPAEALKNRWIQEGQEDEDGRTDRRADS